MVTDEGVTPTRIDIEPAIAAYEARLKLAAEEGIGLGNGEYELIAPRLPCYYRLVQ
mgnify:CR=1 FL=1